MSNAIQLNLWDWLEEATIAAAQMPELVAVADGMTALDAVITSMADAPLLTQLSVAAEAFTQLSIILERKAEQWLNDWDEGDGGLSLEADWMAGLVRQPVRFDLSDMVEEPEPPSKPNRQRPTADSSLAAPVEPEKLLDLIEQLEEEPAHLQAQLAALAGGEEPQRWQETIQRCWDGSTHTHFSQLQQQTGLAPVELWLGLLLGGYCMTPVGEGFYHSDFQIFSQP